MSFVPRNESILSTSSFNSDFLSPSPQTTNNEGRNWYYQHVVHTDRWWRVSRAVQAIAWTVFTFGIALFFESVRTLWFQAWTGKERIKVYEDDSEIDLASYLSYPMLPPTLPLDLSDAFNPTPPPSQSTGIVPLPILPTSPSLPPSDEPPSSSDTSPPVPMRPPYPAGTFPDLSALALKTLLQNPPSSQACSIPALESHKFLEIALKEKLIAEDTPLALFQQAEELDLGLFQFPIPKAFLDKILAHLPNLKSITLPCPPMLSRFSTTSELPVEQLGSPLNLFDAFRYLLAYHPDRLNLKTDKIEDSIQLLGRLNKEESFNFFHVLLRQFDKETIKNWLNEGISYAHKFETGSRQAFDNLLSIFNNMDQAQLLAYSSVLVDYPEDYLRMRNDFFSSLSLERFEKLVDDSNTSDLLSLLIKGLRYSEEKARQARTLLIVSKLLALNPTDGMLFFQLFESYNSRSILLNSLKDRPDQWKLLSEQIRSIADEDKRFSCLLSLLRSVSNLPAEDRLPYISLTCGSSHDLDLVTAKLSKERGKFEQVLVDLTVYQTLQVLNHSNLNEKKSNLLRVLGNFYIHDAGEQEAYASHPALVCDKEHIPLLLSCFALNGRSQVLGEGWMRKILASDDIDYIRANFASFWPLERSFHTYLPGCLAAILSAIDSKEKLQAALETLPESLDMNLRKEYLQALLKEVYYFDFGIPRTYKVTVSAREISEVLLNQTGANKDALHQLGLLF
ncbi:hypothetical protein [Candidatus Protochlamydia phocaeensis]|uniref:hypothetical protein n=1 Tax=Candidatus Protochlamydia phocaeensis TaxID=1414722 RepID=UPI000838E5FE|nr:hypothetical protein [Candidatus Protochlamydia phocaeensis]